jgi:hypothetical protein
MKTGMLLTAILTMGATVRAADVIIREWQV